MSSELSVAALWIRRGREPDWEAAHRAIRDLDLATVWDTGDEYFHWEAGLEDAPNPPESAGVYHGLRAAQGHLVERLEEVRTAVERGTHDMHVVELPEHRLLVSGCVTPGDMPPGPFDAFGDVGEASLARAAGFDGWTAYCLTSLDERRLGFADDEMRSVAATRALMFAEDLALEGRSLTPYSPPRGPNAWRSCGWNRSSTCVGCVSATTCSGGSCSSPPRRTRCSTNSGPGHRTTTNLNLNWLRPRQ